MKSWLHRVMLGLVVAWVVGGATAAAQADIIEVQANNFKFDPNFVIVNRGDTVRWVFTEGTHTTTSDDGFWDSGILNAGTTYEVTFDGTGQYDYNCTIHIDCCNMVGSVYVLDGGNPYDVLVSGYAESSVLRFAADGTPLEPVDAPMSNLNVIAPAGLAIGPDNYLYVANQTSVFVPGMDDSVARVNLLTGEATVFIDLPSGYVPAGLAFGPDGNLYVCHNAGQFAGEGTGSVDVYDGTSGAFIKTLVSNLTQPTALIFDAAGNLYVSNFGDGTIVKVHHKKGRVTTLVAAGSGGLAGPAGLQVGPDGHLYVADLLLGAVRLYNRHTGASLGDFIPAGGALDNQFPSGLLFDDQRNLLVACLGGDFTQATGSVKLFDPQGNYVRDFASGIYGASQVVRTQE